MSARSNLYRFIAARGIGTVSSAELREIGKVDDWARSWRQLKQDGIIEFSYNPSDKTYNVSRINQFSKSSKRVGLSSKDLYRIRHRDGHRCQSCGNGVGDGIKLHVDHRIPLEWGGSNLDDNLWTLCSNCNQAKKAYFSDELDSDVMRQVMKETSGYQKIRVLFELSPNIPFTPSVLQGISGIRDWTRTIRNIRDKYGINIQWNPRSEEYPNGYYSNVP
jgi:hypothetical protein